MRLSAWLPLFVSTVALAAPRTTPSFVSDDYARARVQAVAQKVPLFVEVWAPW